MTDDRPSSKWPTAGQPHLGPPPQTRSDKGGPIVPSQLMEPTTVPSQVSRPCLTDSGPLPPRSQSCWPCVLCHWTLELTPVLAAVLGVAQFEWQRPPAGTGAHLPGNPSHFGTGHDGFGACAGQGRADALRSMAMLQ